jgi:hypothetical protein
MSRRGNRDAAIPVRGGDFIERDGRRYAVLFDADKALVAAYEIVGERLKAAPLGLVTHFKPFSCRGDRSEGDGRHLHQDRAI